MANSSYHNIEISGIVSSIATNEIKSVSSDKKSFNYRRSGDFQTTSDFGFEAAQYILNNKEIDLNEVGVLVFVSKTPDYRGPATSIVMQGRLGLSKDCIAFDVNIGSCGFAFGTQIVCSNLKSVNKNYGLLVFGDTSSKQVVSNSEFSFSDGASAILFQKKDTGKPLKIKTKSYSDYYKDYMIKEGGFRNFRREGNDNVVYDRSIENNFLNINTAQYISFVKSEVITCINDFIQFNNSKSKEYDSLVLHQFNQETLDYLKSHFKDDFKDVISSISEFGNTNSNSIPLALAQSFKDKKNGSIRVLACTYGEGFSLGIMDFYIDSKNIHNTLETESYFKEGYISHE